MRTYKELIRLPTFEERFEYLRVNSKIGLDTFGYDRYLNQAFYSSKEWKKVRDAVIVRDQGCDLGIPDREIMSTIYIHHMNPIQVSDFGEDISKMLDTDQLICCSKKTHNAIHYGDISTAKINDIVERRPNDTCPWKK